LRTGGGLQIRKHITAADLTTLLRHKHLISLSLWSRRTENQQKEKVNGGSWCNGQSWLMRDGKDN